MQVSKFNDLEDVNVDDIVSKQLVYFDGSGYVPTEDVTYETGFQKIDTALGVQGLVMKPILTPPGTDEQRDGLMVVQCKPGGDVNLIVKVNNVNASGVFTIQFN